MAYVYSQGDGSQANPYKIATLADLNGARDYLSAHFELANDIDANITANWNDGAGWLPIGDYDVGPFTGNLDGKGFEITGLFINRPTTNNQGLFGFVQPETATTIKNLILNNFNITGKYYVGGLVGTLSGYTSVDNVQMISVQISASGTAGGLIGQVNGVGTIQHCTISGAVYAASVAGGLLGSLSGMSVSNCSSSCDVSVSSTTAGGLVGSVNNPGNLSDCFATGNVTALTATTNANIGGLIGDLVGAPLANRSIIKSYATGTVNAPNGYNVGGFVGRAYNYVRWIFDRCFSSGQVIGSTYVGGFAGLVKENVEIDNSYATGQVTGVSVVGGFAGKLEYTTYKCLLYYCYSVGLVTGSTAGGFIAEIVKTPTTTECYWDTQTSGQDASARGEGKTTAEMKQQATFYGFNFTTTWNIQEGATYPVLRAFETQADVNVSAPSAIAVIRSDTPTVSIELNELTIDAVSATVTAQAPSPYVNIFAPNVSLITTVSQDYKDAVKADVRKWVPKVLMYLNGDNHPPVDVSEHVVSFSLLDETGADSGTPIGNVSANEFTISLDNSGRKFTPTAGPYYGQLKPGVKVVPYLGLVLPGGSVEYIPLGVFWTQDWSAPSSKIEADVTCYDRLYHIGNLDVPMFPISPNTTIGELFTALFTGLGLSSDEYEVDVNVNQSVNVGWVPAGKVKDALQLLSVAGNCHVRVNRFGTIMVKSNLQGDIPVTTWTDQDQIINADNPQRYSDIYDKVKVNWKIPELKEKGTVLSLSNVDIPANDSIQINTTFNDPVGSVSYIRLEGFGPELDASYGAASIRFTIDNYGDDSIKVAIYVVGQALSFVNSEITKGTGIKELVIDNDLIQNYIFANILAITLHNWLNDPYISYEIEGRGDPALEPGDVMQILVPSCGIENAVISPYRITLDYDGGLSCKINARKPMLLGGG